MLKTKNKQTTHKKTFGCGYWNMQYSISNKSADYYVFKGYVTKLVISKECSRNAYSPTFI